MNQVVIWNDMRLFYGKNPRAVTEHSHPIVQFVLALEESFLSKNSSGHWIKKKGLVIAPNHFHECDANNIPILSIDIDPESNLGEWILINQLKNQKIVDYPFDTLAQVNIEELALNINNEDWAALRAKIEKTFFFQKTFEASQRDERIEKILNYISQQIHQDITTEKLVDVACLSESRLLHLFKEKMGLPIRNYILWYRLKIVMEEVLKGNSLTEASHLAGFADQAHMTRTFTKMTGIPPSILSKNSKFIQVSFPR